MEEATTTMMMIPDESKNAESTRELEILSKANYGDGTRALTAACPRTRVRGNGKGSSLCKQFSVSHYRLH